MSRWIAVAGSVVTSALAATAVLYILALRSLAQVGPNAAGYDLLLDANDAVLVDAVLLALAGVVLVGRGVRRVPGVLLAATAITFVAAAGLQGLGDALAGVQPTRQPLDLNSLLLAVGGSGATLMPAPVILGAAAIASFALLKRPVRPS